MEEKTNLPEVYIYLHPNGKQFLFSPAKLNGNCRYCIVYGFTDEVLNKTFADEKDSEGWYSGPDVLYFMNNIFQQAGKEHLFSALTDILTKNGIKTSNLF